MDIEDLKKHLSDPYWRLNNLYFVKDETGKKVRFEFNEVQKEIYANLWFFNIIPKARQLGVTTFFAILYLDQVLFGENQTAGIIAHRQEDLKKIFKNKIKFAWDNLHPWLKAKIGEPDTNTANELTFPNGGSIFVSMSTRSGTVNFLHISEFGYICQRFPDKAEEIVSGAMNSVHAGQFISIESTAAGRDGHFYDFVQAAEKRRKEGRELTALDFKIFFFPWHIDKRYTLEGDVPIDTDMKDYFDKLEKKFKIPLTDGQKRWYTKKKETNKNNMMSEYPSTLEEAFAVATEGAFYSNEMDKVYMQNRIRPLPIVDGVEVETWWDLGWNDFNVIWFVQNIGPQIRIVDCYYNRNYKLGHYVQVLKEKGYKYGRHILPHDVMVSDVSVGVTRKQILMDEGLSNIIVAPKMGFEDGIELVRRVFSRFYFDEDRTKKIYDALGTYHREWDPKIGQFKDTAKHDEASHFADPARYGAACWSEQPMFGSDEEKEAYEKQTEQSFFGG